MNVQIARVIMGHFMRGNRRAIHNAAKWFDMHPEQLLNKAYIMMGKKSPITTYETLKGGTKTIKNR